MTYNLLRSDGIGALACVSSASGDASFLQCTFQVKYDCKRPRATFSLQYKTDVHGIKQVFDLIYNADNLLPTTTKCRISTRALLPGDVFHVARSNLPELRVLSLHLRKPCPIICPDVESCQIPSRHLVDLAKSENIEIVFDWKWLDSERGSSFTSIVGQPERFSGFSIDQKNLKKRQRQLRDWTIFSPEEENVVVSEEPPPYTDPVHKRPRQEVSSSPSPPTKRVFVIPPGSPTERATTASPPDSPKYTFSASGKSQLTTFLRAVSAHSRFHDEKSLSPNAETDTNVPSESKDDIRSIMLDILPVMLASFIDCRRSVSPSSSSSTEPDTHPTTAPSRESIRQLRSLLTQRAAECIEGKLRTICENVQDDANCLRQAVDEEFLAVVAEEKWDISQRKEDALEELGVEIDKVIQEKLIEFSDELDCLVEQAGINVEKAIDMRAEKSINTTWNKAIASSLLDQETRVGNKARGQEAHAAGDRKRKFYKFRSRTR